MKLDEKAIDKLIEQVLNEKTYVPKTRVADQAWRNRLKFKNTTQSGVSKSDFDAIRGLDRDDAFTTADVEAASKITDPDNSSYKTVRAFANPDNYKDGKGGQHSPLGQARAALSGEAGEKVADGAAEVGGAETVNISDPDGNITAATREAIFGFDLRNAQSSEGSFPPALINVYQTLFKGESTLIGRLKSMTEFSQNILKMSKGKDGPKAALEGMGFKNFILNVMGMDYINSIAKGLDDGSGAYAFESFLALISGGKVAGKEKTSAGQMGAADFTIAGTGAKAVRGSAKYFNKYTGISQSSKGFDLKENSVLHYIIGLKKEVVNSNAPDLDGVSDPLRLKSIDLYYVIIQYAGIEPEKNRKIFIIRDPDGERIGLEVVEDEGSVMINKGPYYTDSTKVGTLILAESDTRRYKELIQSSANNISAEFGAAMEKVKETFSKNQSFKDSTSDYVSDGGLEKGNQMVTNLNLLLGGVQEMIGALKVFGDEYQAPTEKVAAPSVAAESKLSDLDKLILEVLKNNT